MTKKEKIQKLFEESGFTDQLMQLIMSGVLPAFQIDNSLSEGDKEKEYAIIFQYALDAASDLYSDLFKVTEVEELISIHRLPVMKKMFQNSSNMIETVAAALISNNDKMEKEIESALTKK